MEDDWNIRLRWCKLSHVCQRWRHFVYAYAFHLDIHIECTNGTPIMDILDHLPPLPLGVRYKTIDQYLHPTILTEQDESGLYHALRLHDRVRHIDLNLPPSIANKAVVLLDKHFPILEDLCLSHPEAFAAENSIPLPLTLPKAFLAPNLRHLTLPGLSPPRRLRLLTSTVSLVTLELSNIHTSSYFHSRLLVARLQSLPHLAILSIDFSISIPHPSAERKLLGEQEDPVTLPSLKDLRFRGVGVYLESLVAQIRAPLLEELDITLFNQVRAFALPHVSHLINTTEAFKRPSMEVIFDHDSVNLISGQDNSPWFEQGPITFGVIFKQLDLQIDWAIQICHVLIPALRGVERLICYVSQEISTELQNGAIDSAKWHRLLRSFIGVKRIDMNVELMKEFSRALQVDEVRSDPGFLPNLRYIGAKDNLFASFIDTRQAMDRPIQFSRVEFY